jgi:hypothetical protein
MSYSHTLFYSLIDGCNSLKDTVVNITINSLVSLTNSEIFFSVPVCAITASGVPGDNLVSMNRFSTLCG